MSKHFETHPLVLLIQQLKKQTDKVMDPWVTLYDRLKSMHSSLFELADPLFPSQSEALKLADELRENSLVYFDLMAPDGSLLTKHSATQ